MYDHSGLEDYRADAERALSFARPNAPVMQIAGSEGVSRASVYKLAAGGKLPHVRIGHQMRFVPIRRDP